MIERNTFISFGATTDHSIDYLLGIIEDARITTLNRVENISTEELHWQYKEGWNTIGTLLSHITTLGHFFRIKFIEERIFTKQENEAYMPGLIMGKYIPQLITNKSIEEFVEELEEANLKLVEEIKKLNTEAFHKKREGYKKGHNLAWSLYHLAEDEVHHRGQIVILRKLYNSSQVSA